MAKSMVDLSLDFRVKQVDVHNKEMIGIQINQQYATRIDNLRAKLDKLESEREKVKAQVLAGKKENTKTSESTQQSKLRAKLLSIEV